MVIFKLLTDIVEVGWERVIYYGLGNFQDFSGFLWPKLRVPHCKLQAFSLKVVRITQTVRNSPSRIG